MDERIKNIIIDYKSLPNKELEHGLEYLKDDFEKTKSLIVKLTKHLDGLELNYNKILTEYQSRK